MGSKVSAVMKRRGFLQYVGLGSASFWLAARGRSFGSAFTHPQERQHLALETFEFAAATLDKAGSVDRYQKHVATFFPELLNDARPLEMVAIAPGQFWMGAPSGEPQAKRSEFPRHPARLQPFFMSKYPVTQSQWATVAAFPKVARDLDPEPSHFRGADRPVESVSWLDAVEFCHRLSRHTGRRYQLPSEAQWEYACRAGTQTPFNTGETITSQFADYIGTATYRAEAVGEHRRETTPVGHFPPNAFGLCDMHGNVWEWCADAWHRQYRRASSDGRARTGHRQTRAIRGGSWLDMPASLRSASRTGYFAAALNRTIGLRVGMVPL